jgi:acetate kinase
MATRPGAVDPGLLLHLLAHGRVDLAELDDALNHRSGLAGLAGEDLPHVPRPAGEPRAALAFDVYVARLVEGIGAMAAALGGLDALVFTAGVGEHAAEVRAAACAPLGWFGVELDPAANVGATPDADIATPGSRVRVLVVRTREDLVVARETRRLTHG